VQCEKELPEGAFMKVPGEFKIPLGPFLFVNSKTAEKGGKAYAD
jgi:hypothetical protein